jgi:hypothetical protein
MLPQNMYPFFCAPLTAHQLESCYKCFSGYFLLGKNTPYFEIKKIKILTVLREKEGRFKIQHAAAQ